VPVRISGWSPQFNAKCGIQNENSAIFILRLHLNDGPLSFGLSVKRETAERALWAARNKLNAGRRRGLCAVLADCHKANGSKDAK